MSGAYVSGGTGGGGGGATDFSTDAGTAIQAGGIISIVGGGVGIATSGAGNVVTITGSATTAFDGDAGTATPTAGVISIVGAGGATTACAGNVITVTAGGGGGGITFSGDSGTATGAAILLAGGTGITTIGDGASTVTFNLDTPVAVADGGTGAANAAGARTNLGLGSIATQNANNVTITGGAITGITDLVVADGGTGASTLGDGFVLLGSGVGAITALDVTAKGSILVGDGVTDPVALAVGANDFVLTADNGEASGLKWAAAGAGGMPDREFFFGAESLQPLETNFAPLEKLAGANVNVFVRAFDDTTEEYANGKLQVPGDVSTTGADTVTFRAYCMAKTAAGGKNIGFTFGWEALNDSEDFDVGYTEEDSTAKPIDANQDDVSEITWTETITNLGWTANELVLFRLSRDTGVADDLAGDLYLFSLCVEIPRE